MIALLEASRAGLFARAHWMRNIVAGTVVGIVALPLAMAFAIASGVKPEQGLYTAIIAGLAVSLFGGSRIQIAGPTGAFVVILAAISAEFGVDGLLLASFMAGVILVLFGLARLGAVIRFIPDPVILGFTAGIGVVIWVGQWRDFFGLPEVVHGHFHETFWHLLQALPQLHVATTALGLLSLIAALWAPRLPGLRRVPGPLVAMLLATLLQAAFAFPGVATIGSAFGGIPQGLPSLRLPEIDLDRILLLLPSAFSIALLGAIESLLSAVVADGMAGTRHDSNQELIGQGIANLLSPLFGGIAATGAIARTATNFRNGATGPLAGIVHSLFLVLVLLFLAPLAAQIPLCALAAILFVVAWNMSDPHQVLRVLRTAPAADVAILLITFALTVLVDLVVAVQIGVILAMLQFVRRMASSVQLLPVGDRALPPATLAYSIEGPLFFGAVDQLEGALSQTDAKPRFVVIRLLRVPFMDITGLQALQEAIGDLEHRGVRVLLCEACPRVMRKLVRVGLIRREAPPRYFAEFSAALEHCAQAAPLA